MDGWRTTEDPGRREKGLSVDDDGVLGYHLDRAVVLDVHNAAAHGLSVGEIDQDAIA